MLVKGFHGTAASALKIIIIAGLAVSALWLLHRYMQWVNTHFVITSQRVIFRTGIVAKSGIEIPLDSHEVVVHFGEFISRTHLMAKGGAATGFEVAGADGKFVAATARVEGETVLVASLLVADPVAVRYGWANSPECNLFNGEGLPASPFSSQQ